jgi:staphylococcal nuclease domain-containing protein 1
MAAPAPTFTPAARAAEGATLCAATVKHVLSGDCLVVVRLDEPSRSGPPADRLIAMSSVRAPVLGRPESKDRPATRDEPYAWQSREYLRHLLIGQRVTYVSEFTNPKTGREYCTVYFQDEHVGIRMAAEGLVAVLPPTRDPRPDHAEMLRVSQIAQEEGRGIFDIKNRATAIRNPKAKFSAFELYEKKRGVAVPAVVEQIRNGSTIRVTLQETFDHVVVRLAGVQAPVPLLKQEEEPPFFKDAKFILEQVLLGRDVELHPECIDKVDGVVFARVSCGGKDPAELLLQTGLARFVEWNAPRSVAQQYKALQEKAQAGRIRLWSLPQNAETLSQSGSSSSSSGNASGFPQQIMGVVREITNGCGLVLAEETAKVDIPPALHTINLSSLVVPRLAGPGGHDEPWAWEAKELLRGKLIGKSVKAVLDYVRPASDSLPEKPYYTVYLGGTNVAIMLLERGLAKVMVHRQSDPRSCCYAALLGVEQKAASKHKGVHGPPDQAPKHHTSDLSRNTNVKKASQFLPFLKQPARQSAVVEFVFGGDRVKLHCPKATCMINLTLSGIRCPRTKKGEPDEPFAAEVNDYAKANLLQRDVEIEATAVDRGGSFLGVLYTKEGKDWGLHLVERGMAALHRPSAQRLPNSAAYFQAEEKAKAQRLRIWSNWTPEMDKAAEEEEMMGEDKQDWERVRVTEVLDGATFYYQNEAAIPDLEDLSQRINAAVPEYTPSFIPHVGTTVLCQYSDGWYRARVTAVSDDKKEYEVLFIDYGNMDTVPHRLIRRCDPSFLELGDMAKEGVLAYVIPPALHDDFGNDAAMYLKDLVWDKTLVATLEYMEHGKAHLVLGDPQGNVMVNSSIVRAGYAQVAHNKSKKAQAVMAKLRTAEEQARKAHVNIWRYGDLPDPELDEPELPVFSAGKVRK